MAKCVDFWCEHYDKNKGNCGKCIKNEETKEKSNLSVISAKTRCQANRNQQEG